ncbi:ADP-ribose pyrophosphatase YjhB (NUDIX family) [Leucobacter komagatae]|uniref:ADP-ribose pyrophosphatase YjhB (NUDIX family) n=1 Tax=Leucobacter komagatae TaxID=55969 RepID=A0A542XY23_9MICO|nr:NUDIX domain-containing protein [Leucobacter komagatae]TQL40735.1 ADP-ribose pyrophosphatase YjhB (NUDIX family) [Leucobacter komagatae]
MSFADSYLGKLRQRVGSAEMLVPGAQVLLLVDDEHAIFQRRADSGKWEIPAGSAEPGQSFADTAVAEVLEELGLRVEPDALTAFASFSDPVEHRLVYPNGDIVHAFALCFFATEWSGEIAPDPGEVREWGVFPLAAPPEGLQRATRLVLELFHRYRTTGAFQAG